MTEPLKTKISKVPQKTNSNHIKGEFQVKKLACLWLTLLMVLSIALTGCNKSVKTSDTPDKKEKVTIKFWAVGNDANPDDLTAKWLKETVQKFEDKNPNIKVDYTPVANGDEYLTKISTEMAANNAPDVFYCWVAERLKPFVKAGRVLPLNDIIEGDAEFKSVLNTGLLEPSTFDGKVYAIPNEIAGEVIYYNKELFTKYNVKVPETWNELLTAIKTFKENGITPFSLANKDSWIGTIPYMYIFDRLHGPDKYKEVMINHEAKFNDSAYIEAAKRLVELRDAGAYPNNFNSLGSAEGEALFKTGKAAMSLQGTWNLATNEKNLGDKLGVINFPDIEGGKGSKQEDWIVFPNSTYSISNNTKHKDEAAKLLKFIFSKERQAAYANIGALVATKNIPVDASKLNPITVELNKKLTSAKYPEIAWDILIGQNLGKELNLATQQILGGADIKDTFNKLNKLAEQEWKK